MRFCGGEVIGWPRPSDTPLLGSSRSGRSLCYKSKRRPSLGLAEPTDEQGQGGGQGAGWGKQSEAGCTEAKQGDGWLAGR